MIILNSTRNNNNDNNNNSNNDIDCDLGNNINKSAKSFDLLNSYNIKNLADLATIDSTSKSSTCIATNATKNEKLIIDTQQKKVLKKHDYDYGHELNSETNHHFCYHYYTLWQSEMFKAKALERENEKLDNLLKLTQSKLDKEIVQQIKISLEWRKVVVELVDENTKLKHQLAKLKDNSSSSSSSI